jgi:hypothetical protein
VGNLEVEFCLWEVLGLTFGLTFDLELEANQKSESDRIRFQNLLVSLSLKV